MYRRWLWLPLLVCLVFAGCSPQQSTETLASVVINEVQTSGDEYDWIELHNPSEEAVALGGCFLSNDPKEPGKWQFPAVTIEAGGYLLICADDTINDERLCAPFRLNAGGTTLRLSAHSGAVLQELVVPAGASGLSYGVTDNGYAWYASPTPNVDNRNGLLLGEQKTVEQYGLRINEYMSRNRSVLYDENGDYSDWVELHNFSDTDIDLGGYALTDARSSADKWRFPQGVVIPADGYLVVRCSGRDTVTAGGELHTNFKLGTADSFVGLYTPDGAFCSGIDYTPTEQDRSRGYLENGGYAVLNYPTPGYTNVPCEVAS